MECWHVALDIFFIGWFAHPPIVALLGDMNYEKRLCPSTKTEAVPVNERKRKLDFLLLTVKPLSLSSLKDTDPSSLWNFSIDAACD